MACKHQPAQTTDGDTICWMCGKFLIDGRWVDTLKKSREPRPEKTEAQREQEKAARERLNNTLETQLIYRGLRAGHEFEREFKAVEGREYRWDFYLKVNPPVLIEVQGGTRAKDRKGHSTGSGLHRDYEKANLAAEKQFLTVFLDTDMIKDESGAELVLRIYNESNSNV